MRRYLEWLTRWASLALGDRCHLTGSGTPRGKAWSELPLLELELYDQLFD